jgi:hypothetical protein
VPDLMNIVPVIKSGELPRSIRFYMEVLDFERKWPEEDIGIRVENVDSQCVYRY